MAFCRECGTSLPDSAEFCSECGTPVQREQPPKQSEESRNDWYQQERQTEQQSTRQDYQVPPAFYGNTQPPAVEDKPLGPWMYVLLMFVFSLPLAGFITMIVMVCGGAKNKNMRNFAWAYLIWLIIGIVLVILFALVLAPLMMEAVEELEYYFDDYGYYYSYSSMRDTANYAVQLGSVCPSCA